MAQNERDHKPTPKALAELTGRPIEEFEPPEDAPKPAPEDLESHDAAELYSGDEE